MISIEHPAAQYFVMMLDNKDYLKAIEKALDSHTPIYYFASSGLCHTTLTPEETQFLFAHWRLTHD